MAELPEGDEILHDTGQASWQPGERPQSAANTMYMILFMLALFGFVVVPMLMKAPNGGKTVIPAIQKEKSVEPAADTETEMKAMLEQAFWLQAAILVTFILGTILLIVYIGLRVAGLRPVRQVPLNNVTWTLGSLVKGFVIALFIVMVLGYTGGPLLLPLGLHLLAVAALITAVFELLVVAWVVLMLRFEYNARPADFGLRFRKPLREVGYAFLTYLVVFPVFQVATIAWRYIGEFFGFEYEAQPLVAFLVKTDSVASILIVTVSAVIVAPIAEEFFFRVFTYSALRRRFGVFPSVIVTSAYFALIHPGFFSFLPIFILGAALAFLYERRQSIVAPVAMHFFHNSWVVGSILLLRYVNS